MAKLPRKASGRDKLKVLGKHGFTIRPGRGDHMVAVKDDRYIAVPLHKALKIGTLNVIIKQSGIPRDVFLKEL